MDRLKDRLHFSEIITTKAIDPYGLDAEHLLDALKKRNAKLNV